MYSILPTDREDLQGVDYSIIEKYTPDWEKLSEISRSIILVLDCFTGRFVFVSENGLSHFDVNVQELIEKGHAPILELLHPEDVKYGLAIRKKIYDHIRSLPSREQKQLKLFHEMRFKNLNGQYVRVIEQEQIISFDASGKAWLILSIIDADAGHQDEITRSHIYNCVTGEHIYPDLSDLLEEPLTKKEVEILFLMKMGLLAKEMAFKLNISVNTVNTHRQNILRKLDANNAMEAVNRAFNLGVI
ncbi:MAG: LuxR C-terminal-related transcriptional regulator [Tannerellaceae bacterium]|nr:LuxR C-terminal-related transcriptional regulator [Tannerellaceae bacterium]